MGVGPRGERAGPEGNQPIISTAHYIISPLYQPHSIYNQHNLISPEFISQCNRMATVDVKLCLKGGKHARYNGPYWGLSHSWHLNSLWYLWESIQIKKFVKRPHREINWLYYWFVLQIYFLHVFSPQINYIEKKFNLFIMFLTF